MSSLTARVSAALSSGNYVDARVHLAEMRIRKLTPKLGSLQRWVRDCDAIASVSERVQREESDPDSSKAARAKNELMQVLEAILRVVEETSTDLKDQIVVRHAAWDQREDTCVDIYRSVRDGSLYRGTDTDVSADVLRSRFSVLEVTPGKDRKPENLHPAILYQSSEDAVSLAADIAPVICKIQHPRIKSIHMLKSVLLPSECRAVIRASEVVGFTPDSPINTLGSSETSVLAHNVYWLADTKFISALEARVEKHLVDIAEYLPNGYGKFCGINRRFRVYRYVPGALYRPHLDGAWPPSGTVIETASDGTAQEKYVYDTSGGKISSKLTFLLYLNDEFDGGETTFFTPSSSEGVLDAWAIKPVAGAAVIFPHGEAEGALLHEGSGVLGEDSAKYIIRSDVLFQL